MTHQWENQGVVGWKALREMGYFIEKRFNSRKNIYHDLLTFLYNLAIQLFSFFPYEKWVGHKEAVKGKE